jgi:hypothetical protein
MSDWNYHFGIELLNQASHLLKHGYRQQGLDTFQNQGKLYADQVRGNLEEQCILDNFANIACWTPPSSPNDALLAILNML